MTVSFAKPAVSAYALNLKNLESAQSAREDALEVKGDARAQRVKQKTDAIRLGTDAAIKQNTAATGEASVAAIATVAAVGVTVSVLAGACTWGIGLAVGGAITTAVVLAMVLMNRLLRKPAAQEKKQADHLDVDADQARFDLEAAQTTIEEEQDRARRQFENVLAMNQQRARLREALDV